MREVMYSDKAPKPAGQYCHATKAGNTVYLSGQVSMDPNTDEVKRVSVEEQTEIALNNLKAVIEDIGGSLDDFVKCNVYISDFQYSKTVNEVYTRFFPENPPARITVAVKGIAADLDVEIDAIAYLEDA